MTKQLSATERAERLVLGACMIDAQAYWRIQERLESRHFGKSLHRDIWTAIGDVAAKSGHIDHRLITARLPEESDGVLVNSYVAVLITEAQDGVQVDDFSDIIIDSYVRKRSIEAIDKARKKLLSVQENSYDALADLETTISALSTSGDAADEMTIGQAARAVINRTSEAHKQDKKPGLTTGLSALDELIGPMLPGQLIVMIAPSGSGKTALAMQIAMHCARGDLSTPAVDVWFAQADMNADDVAERQIASDTAIQARQIRSAQLNRSEFDMIFDSANELERARLTIYDRAQPTQTQIERRCMAAKRQGRLGLIIGDHLKCFQSGDPRIRGFERFEFIVPRWKLMAKSLGVPALLLTQPTRESQKSEDPRPKINSAWGGGVIEESADVVFSLFREESWLKANKPPQDSDRYIKWENRLESVNGLAELTLLKDRFGEANKTKTVKWEGARTRFLDL